MLWMLILNWSPSLWISCGTSQSRLHNDSDIKNYALYVCWYYSHVVYNDQGRIWVFKSEVGKKWSSFFESEVVFVSSSFLCYFAVSRYFFKRSSFYTPFIFVTKKINRFYILYICFTIVQNIVWSIILYYPHPIAAIECLQAFFSKHPHTTFTWPVLQESPSRRWCCTRDYLWRTSSTSVRNFFRQIPRGFHASESINVFLEKVLGKLLTGLEVQILHGLDMKI